ncbi:MAG: fasciclin domain-containing protein [Actinobacteria bacterium]|nr:fasciclin domain-containing protein [Actinomycetota bacterium]
MKIRTVLPIVAAVALVGVVAAGCSSGDDSESSNESGSSTTKMQETEMSEETVVDVAVSNEDFSTLVSAVQKAGLAETLAGEGPFTVFAPTNEAFAKIPPDQLQAILDDPELLQSVLTYHVLPANVQSSDLQPQQSPATVQGATVDVKVGADGATINGCKIVKTDIKASNGVIHVIDCVLVPPR